MYEDALCPYCRKFEHTFGATVDTLIDSGAVAADYYMVAILDRPGRDFSSRAAPPPTVSPTSPATRSGASMPRYMPTSPPRPQRAFRQRRADRHRTPSRRR
ncbi:MAG TPA: hypothetical protein VE197_00105 [Mycobacterium sp.]|nr:hypothetical protein [Mycobacterium sp.]